MLRERLEEMGSFYGAFPAHDALWDSAAATAHSLPARLAIEHCTHEARGWVPALMWGSAVHFWQPWSRLRQRGSAAVQQCKL